MTFLKLNNPSNHFIIAAPRSGTTWMSKMLNAHPEVLCVERRLFGNYADFILDTGTEKPRLRVTLDKYINSLVLHHGYPKNKINNLFHSILESLIKEERKFSKKKIVVDKITPYLDTSNHVLENINTFFPDSKIIYMIRDGRDVLTSGIFHWFNKQTAESNLTDFELQRREAFLGNGSIKHKRFFQDKEIEQWANEWMQPLQTFKKAKENHQVKIVYYEDLLLNTKDVLLECLSFLKAKNTSKIIDTCIDAGNFKKMSKGREKGDVKYNAHVRKGIAGDWQNYFSHEDGKLFHEIAGNALLEFGYEENGSWFEKLR